MPITDKEYRELQPQLEPELDAFIVDARALLRELLRPFTSSEQAEEVRLLRRRPSYYEEAAAMGERIYEPIRDVTLEADGFPPWKTLSSGQQRVILFRLGGKPHVFQRMVVRGGLLLARDLRKRSAALLEEQKMRKRRA